VKVKHPEMPKKPLTPYFRFFMRKRVAYAKKHPDMSVTELTKELSKKYGSLPEHKKVCFENQRLWSGICPVTFDRY
jgi:upstream-binding transcription factor